MEHPELKGYLRKKSRKDRWQRRYFEATTHYLTYYKKHDSDKMLACIDLWRTTDIRPNDDDPARREFYIIIGEQSYLLKAENASEAQRWLEGLNTRQYQPEGVRSSEMFIRPSEAWENVSDVSSSHYTDYSTTRYSITFDTKATDSGRRPSVSTGSDLGGRRSRVASSDTGSIGSTARQGHVPVNTNYTDSQSNPIVPNADAINAQYVTQKRSHPMLNAETTVSPVTRPSPAKQAPQVDRREERIEEACCAPCRPM